MTRIACTNRDNQEITYSQLATNGINEFLDYLAKHKSMEFVSLVSTESQLKWCESDIKNFIIQNILKIWKSAPVEVRKVVGWAESEGQILFAHFYKE